MHVRAAPGPGPGRIHLGRAIGRPYHPDQGGPWRRGVAPGAGPQRDVTPPHRYAPAGASGAAAACDSDLMSMRQPVSRAASRAFWPSFPIASDSW